METSNLGDAMNKHERDFFVSRIDLGYLHFPSDDGLLIIKEPTKEHIYEAQFVYNSYLDLDTFNSVHMEVLLLNTNMINEDDQFDYLNIPKQLEDLKIDIFKNFDGDTKRFRADYEKLENRFHEVLNKKHAWDSYTAEGIAALAKTYYLIEKNTYKNGQLYDFENVSLEQVLLYYKKNYIDDTKMRLLARTDPWLSIYDNRSGGKIFEQETDDQQRLLSYTNMYKNIREHGDCPKEAIINDDLALDGWVLYQRRERDRDKAREQLDKKLNPKVAQAQDVYVPSAKDTFGKSYFGNYEKAKEIDNLNDEQAKNIKKQRMKQTEGKVLSVTELQDIKNKVQMELNARQTQVKR